MLDIIFYDNKIFYKIPDVTKEYYYINKEYEVISIYCFNKIKYLKYYKNEYRCYKEDTYYYLLNNKGERKPYSKFWLFKLHEIEIERIKRRRWVRK